MFNLRLSNPMTLILGGGLLYTCLMFPIVKLSTLANSVDPTSFNQAFAFSLLCFGLLCLGLRIGERLSERASRVQPATEACESAVTDLRPMIVRSLLFWLVGLVFAVAIIMTIFGGFGSLSSAVATRNDLVRGKAWLFTLILPLKIGVFGIFLCLLTTKLRSNRILLLILLLPMFVISVFFLNTIGGRLFACGLILQLLIVCGQVLKNRQKLLFFTEFFSVICLAIIIGLFGLSRYATSVGLSRDVDSSEVVHEILRDAHTRDQMLLDNFFDPWYPLTEAVSYLEGRDSPLYGLYHVTAFAKLVPGLYRYVEKHTSANQFHSDANLGKRTIPYGVNAYLDFHWVGASLFFVIGIVQSYSINRLRRIEESSQGLQCFIANYLISCVCIFSLYLFRSGMTIAVSWGIAELMVLFAFLVFCIIQVRPNATV
ncbi:hypothetical protein SH528x_002904 [Novipirellula sp. SH528]|uniref:hypothetical protein n=1 Tax=Novipirellula sp. SH528 TaxID=3454466 RepID=UPI003FA0DCFD